MRRLRRLGAAAALGLLAVLAGGPAGADTPAVPSLGGYNVSADGNAVDILVDNTTGLAGVHPLSEADFPEAESSFETGPFGSGLADVFWPGGPAADFGSLAPEVGFPPSSAPLYTKLYDPVRASAQYPSGPESSSYPPNGPPGVFEMQSRAGPTGVTSKAAMVDQQSGAAVLGFSQAKGSSAATAANAAVGSASSDLSNVKLLGGLIDIGSITSSAQVSSDGSQPATGSALTHISGVTVLGQPATFGSDGLVLPDFAKALGPVTGPVVQNAVSQTVTGLGLTVKELPAVETADGESYTATSGGVAVRIVPPSSAATLLEQAGAALAPLFPAQAAIIPTLPGLLQGFTMTITLGRATAATDASPPFSSSFNPSAIPTSTVGAGSPGTSASSASSAVTGALGGGTGAAPAPATIGGGSAPSAAAPQAGGSTRSGPATLVSLTSPLGAGAVAVGVIVAGLLGYALWRLARTILPRDAAPVCPLGQDNR